MSAGHCKFVILSVWVPKQKSVLRYFFSPWLNAFKGRWGEICIKAWQHCNLFGKHLWKGPKDILKQHLKTLNKIQVSISVVVLPTKINSRERRRSWNLETKTPHHVGFFPRWNEEQAGGKWRYKVSLESSPTTYLHHAWPMDKERDPELCSINWTGVRLSIKANGA